MKRYYVKCQSNFSVILCKDLEFKIVLCESYNKGAIEISKVKNEFLYKNLEDLYTSLNKQKITYK